MKKILLIEDNADIRLNTAEILELANYNVVTAQNGKEGVAIALKEKPDLVICDIMMPLLDGYGVLLSLQKNQDTMNTPFIFLTAKTEKADLRKGMEAGADDYITKPFTGTELLNAVEGRLKKATLQKQQFLTEIARANDPSNLATETEILNALTEGRNTNKYKRKQIIYLEGNRPNRLYYIIKGKVKTYKTNDNGKELVVELFNKGDFFGYTALLEQTTYKETAEPMEDSEIALIPKEDFEELIYSNPVITKKFIRMLAREIRETEEHLLGLAYNSLRKKVADALILIDDKYNASQDQKFTIGISRENLATIAGTATESLIRTLTDFKNEKLIDMDHGGIVLKDKPRLQNMLN